jgi:hypothetical protein
MFRSPIRKELGLAFEVGSVLESELNSIVGEIGVDLDIVRHESLLASSFVDLIERARSSKSS